MTTTGDPGGTTTIAQLCQAVPGALLPVVPDDPDIAARAIHVSELVDPTGYLDGGEVLLTTGMALPLTPSGCRAYVQRLHRLGIAALVLGLGPVHTEVPRVLIRACERTGLPLLMVPPAVPFQVVTRAFWSLVGGAQERRLQEALLSHQRLVIAAASSNPRHGLLTQLADAVDGHAVITDPRGHAHVASSSDWHYEPADLQHAVERLRHSGPRTAATLPLGGHHAVIHPVVCDGQIVSYLAVASDQPTSHTRSLILTALALLSMEASTRRTSMPSRYTARAALAHLVDRGHADLTFDLAEHLGIEPPPERVRVAVIHSATTGPLQTLVAALPADTSRWWGTTAEHGAWLLLSSRQDEPDPQAVTAALADADSTARVVIGPVVPLGEVHEVRTMLAARARTLEPGSAQAWRPTPAVPFVTREWAESTLSPLLQAGESILATVTSYLRNRGSWQRTAADLGLHRNSVRAHIARAEQALGEKLSDPDTMARLWLALRETRIVDPRGPGTPTT